MGKENDVIEGDYTERFWIKINGTHLESDEISSKFMSDEYIKTHYYKYEVGSCLELLGYCIIYSLKADEKDSPAFLPKYIVSMGEARPEFVVSNSFIALVLFLKRVGYEKLP